MTEKPLVSVIINCYNGEKYLREAIDSVMAQTYENWELVFWDNQSTDSTREIVESYGDPRIHYFYAPEHTTLGKARNLAVEKANGEYINFLDADDIWMSEKLEKQIGLVERGVCEVVYTNFDMLYNSSETYNEKMLSYYRRLQNRKLLKGKSMYENLLISNFIIFSSVLFNRKLFVLFGGINEQFNQNEDYEILLKCSLRTEFKTTNTKDVMYRVHQGNNSSVNGYSYLEENRLIFNNLPNSKELIAAKQRNEMRYAFSYYKNGNIMKAAAHFLKHANFTQALNILLYKTLF